MTKIHLYPDEDSVGDLTTMHDGGERHRSLAEGTGQILWQTNAIGEIVIDLPDWEAYTGQGKEQTKDWGWLEAVHPDDRESTAQAWKLAIETKAPYRTEHRLRHHGGDYRWMSVRGLPVLDTNHVIQEWVGLHTDITDRKTDELKLKEQAKELTKLNHLLAQTMALVDSRNRELDQFTHTIAHDLKAPLRAVSNLSQWIEDDLTGKIPAENEHQLQLLRSRVSRMEALIDGLLEYSRIGRVDHGIETVVVTELLKDILDSIAPPASFNIKISIDIPPIKTQRWLLSQVFSNLVSNAVKHHGFSHGNIEITGKLTKNPELEPKSCYEFSVIDDGVGIPAQQHERIFGIFQTLDNNTASTGIGLAIVKKIIDGEDESLTLSSTVGQGTIFRFSWSESLLSSPSID
jgi:PAS domain S-box-containing protein